MGSLSSTAHIITQEFIPNQLQVYARENWQMSSYARPYNSSLPKYLHNRPVAVVKHMDRRSRASDSIPASVVKEQEVAGMFKVSSETSTGTSYNVTLGDSTNIPSCSCLDFSKCFLLCKHFFAVFKHSTYTWDDLPEWYRSSPYLTLEPFFQTQEHEVCAMPFELDTCTDQQDNVDSEDGIAIQIDDPTDCNQIRNKFLSTLKNVQSYAFICDSSEVLKDGNTTLTELLDKLIVAAPLESGLPVHKDHESTAKLRVKQLPLTRKRKNPFPRKGNIFI